MITKTFKFSIGSPLRIVERLINKYILILKNHVAISDSTISISTNVNDLHVVYNIVFSSLNEEPEYDKYEFKLPFSYLIANIIPAGYDPDSHVEPEPTPDSSVAPDSSVEP